MGIAGSRSALRGQPIRVMPDNRHSPAVAPLPRPADVYGGMPVELYDGNRCVGKGQLLELIPPR